MARKLMSLLAVLAICFCSFSFVSCSDHSDDDDDDEVYLIQYFYGSTCAAVHLDGGSNPKLKIVDDSTVIYTDGGGNEWTVNGSWTITAINNYTYSGSYTNASGDKKSIKFTVVLYSLYYYTMAVDSSSTIYFMMRQF